MNIPSEIVSLLRTLVSLKMKLPTAEVYQAIKTVCDEIDSLWTSDAYLSRGVVHNVIRGLFCKGVDARVNALLYKLELIRVDVRNEGMRSQRYPEIMPRGLFSLTADKVLAPSGIRTPTGIMDFTVDWGLDPDSLKGLSLTIGAVGSFMMAAIEEESSILDGFREPVTWEQIDGFVTAADYVCLYALDPRGVVACHAGYMAEAHRKTMGDMIDEFTLTITSVIAGGVPTKLKWSGAKREVNPFTQLRSEGESRRVVGSITYRTTPFVKKVTASERCVGTTWLGKGYTTAIGLLGEQFGELDYVNEPAGPSGCYICGPEEDFCACPAKRARWNPFTEEDDSTEELL